jgi:hypothetical protein
MTDWQQHDREQRQLMWEFTFVVFRYIADVATPVLLAMILWKIW